MWVSRFDSYREKTLKQSSTDGPFNPEHILRFVDSTLAHNKILIAAGKPRPSNNTIIEAAKTPMQYSTFRGVKYST
ncbi:hypothetical protein LTR56_025739 [Elasticomyces elasticus]|nr:hypothetical protein LTR56_025739 [Elasticomyces elasticus]KAK3653069.1 hypothetical protein LTR22_011307 [Elasticomyces elasticus]KAK4919688.1 hypothetical protein LTR49_012752 [Elasticomyces elasticus]KAK5749153.1 hypothetical protein LTS12_020776 [Elasticomyces elasticus]